MKGEKEGVVRKDGQPGRPVVDFELFLTRQISGRADFAVQPVKEVHERFPRGGTQSSV